MDLKRYLQMCRAARDVPAGGVAFDAAHAGVTGEEVSSLTSASWTIAGANRAMVGLALTLSPGTTVFTPTDFKYGGSGGTSITKISADITNTNYIGNVWGSSSVQPPAGATNSYCALGGAGQFDFMLSASYTGVNQTTRFGTVTSATGTTDAVIQHDATITVSTPNSNELVHAVAWGLITAGSSGGITPSDPNSRLRSSATYASTGFAGAVDRVATSTSTVMTVRFTTVNSCSTKWAIVAFIINAA